MAVSCIVSEIKGDIGLKKSRFFNSRVYTTTPSRETIANISALFFFSQPSQIPGLAGKVK